MDNSEDKDELEKRLSECRLKQIYQMLKAEVDKGEKFELPENEYMSSSEQSKN